MAAILLATGLLFSWLSPYLIHYCFKSNSSPVILSFQTTDGYKTLLTLTGLFQEEVYINKMYGTHNQLRAIAYSKQVPLANSRYLPLQHKQSRAEPMTPH